MSWGPWSSLLRFLRIPQNARPGDPQIFIGGGADIPAELQAYYSLSGEGPVIGCLLFRGASTDSYHYIALVDAGTAGELDFGVCEAGVVQEQAIFPSNASLQPFASTDMYYDTGPGNPAEVWHSATLQNGWFNDAAPNVTCQYRRVASPPQSVQIVGTIKPGTKVDGTVLFNLPAGYRPASTQFFPVATNASVAGGTTPQVQVNTNGDVKCYGCNVGLTNIELNCMVSLDA